MPRRLPRLLHASAPHAIAPLAAALLAGGLLAACSGDDSDDAAPATAGTETTEVETREETAATKTQSTDATAAATTTGGATAAPGTTAPATTTVPPLPGAASEDPTCRAAGDFFSSLNALVYPLSTSFLDTAEAGQAYATLEVLAAPSVLVASGELERNWPDDAAGELAAVKSGFLDPFVARQQAAVDALTAAGVTAAEQEQLATTWQALVTSGGTATDVTDLRPERVGVEAGLAAKLDAAGVAFLAAQGPILESGVFGNQVTYPQLERYLADACPDVFEIVASNF